MALKGECLSTGAPNKCCGKKLELRICKSQAGYYIGTICPMCGPYSRESVHYWSSYEDAKVVFESGEWARRSI